VWQKANKERQKYNCFWQNFYKVWQYKSVRIALLFARKDEKRSGPQ